MAVGPGIVLNYIWAGLFHPARRVRVSYWRCYSDSYIAQGDALIPFFPFGMDENEGVKRNELYIVL